MKWTLAFAFALAGCGSAAAVAKAPATHVSTSTQIVTQDRDTTEPELFARAERELAQGDYASAKRDFELLLQSNPSEAILPKVLFDLGTTYEALGERERAAGAYHALATKFPALPSAKDALIRCVWLHAFLEQWTPLGETGETILARSDLDQLDKATGLGARGLSRAELGDTRLAMRDVQNGIDILEDNRIGMAGKLPAAGSQLKFALGETRRIETEQIQLRPIGDDFVQKVSARCQGLLDAQAAYADAMRTTDPHFAMMAGYRLGDMYRKLHAELMSIPPDGFAKTEHQRQVFYAIMHVRYRALLDKALIMLNTTLDVADKLGDKSAWVDRGREAKGQMETALAEEKTTIAKFPWTEDEIEKALRIMQEKAQNNVRAKSR
ncbi:MAG TPA: tetratricopeptide repeat protein [Polyangiaceae bacterium]|jgi:tetratricopeptide (TPR) repeat protein|nr:tetratricopeptide repeat protein [Polyangiaceae bacterium]